MTTANAKLLTALEQIGDMLTALQAGISVDVKVGDEIAVNNFPADPATQTTLAAIQALLTPTPVKSWVATDGWKLASAPASHDTGHGAILTASFLAGAMALYALPSGKAKHSLALTAVDNTADFDCYYDAYEIHALPAAFTLNDWLSAGVKVVDNLRFARSEANAQPQINIESQASYILFVLRTVTLAPNPQGCFRVVSW